MPGRIGAEARQIDDREFRLEPGEFAVLGPDQQRADEKTVPGELVDHADADAVLGLRAAVQVLHEQVVLLGQGGHEVGLQSREVAGLDRGVVIPPDITLGLGVADDELVPGGTAGVLARLHDQRAVLCEQALATLQRLLDEAGGAEIPVQGRVGVDALI